MIKKTNGLLLDWNTQQHQEEKSMAGGYISTLASAITPEEVKRFLRLAGGSYQLSPFMNRNSTTNFVLGLIVYSLPALFLSSAFAFLILEVVNFTFVSGRSHSVDSSNPACEISWYVIVGLFFGLYIRTAIALATYNVEISDDRISRQMSKFRMFSWSVSSNEIKTIRLRGLDSELTPNMNWISLEIETEQGRTLKTQVPGPQKHRFLGGLKTLDDRIQESEAE